MIEFSIPSVLRERASLQLNEKAFTFVDYGQDWDGVAENLNSNEEVMHKLGVIKSEVTSPISKSHGLSVADLVVVPPGSIPITTSGKARRQTCVEHYRQDQFARLDA